MKHHWEQWTAAPQPVYCKLRYGFHEGTTPSTCGAGDWTGNLKLENQVLYQLCYLLGLKQTLMEEYWHFTVKTWCGDTCSWKGVKSYLSNIRLVNLYYLNKKLKQENDSVAGEVAQMAEHQTCMPVIPSLISSTAFSRVELGLVSLCLMWNLFSYVMNK